MKKKTMPKSDQVIPNEMKKNAIKKKFNEIKSTKTNFCCF